MIEDVELQVVNFAIGDINPGRVVERQKNIIIQRMLGYPPYPCKRLVIQSTWTNCQPDFYLVGSYDIAIRIVTFNHGFAPQSLIFNPGVFGVKLLEAAKRYCVEYNDFRRHPLDEICSLMADEKILFSNGKGYLQIMDP